MTSYLGKSCSFGLLCVSCLGVCQFVSFLFSLLNFSFGCGIVYNTISRAKLFLNVVCVCVCVCVAFSKTAIYEHA